MTYLFYGSLAAWLFSAIFIFVRHREYGNLLSRLPKATTLLDLQERIARKEELAKEAEEELLVLREKGKEAQATLDQAHYDYDELIKRKDEAENFLKDNGVTLDELDQKINSKCTELAAAREELGRIQEDRAKALQERQDEAERFAKMRQELDALQQQLASVAAKHQLLSSENEALTQSTKELRAKVKDLEDEESLAKITLKETQERLATLNDSIKKAQVALDDIEKQRKALRSSIADLTKQKQNVEAEVSAGQAKLKGIERITESAIASRTQALEQLDKALTIIQPPKLETRLEDLYRPYLKLEEGATPKRPSKATEDGILEDFHGALKQEGLVFSKRTIRAFHTSLKTAEQSPLVVLAGISGTGKSLLPKLYAEYLGIHFLNVAVQPRWDSPQDLFGFYNYMEHRFKATELTRLLWQMDRYNNRASDSKNGKKEIGSFQDGMALVLLDEMNLARVEYYFSELLSKLEFRRSVDVTKDDARRKAELEIECGSLKDDAHPPRLFVGKNILFAGTMNEDETTQVLSDKVVDRANVLRFGKPELKEQQSSNRDKMNEFNANAFANTSYMPQGLWSQWQNHASLKLEDVQKHLQVVNEALNRVGRPYGHRVQDAIQQYIAMYPNSTQQSELRNAFADQIEQKIIPKLSGLDRMDDYVPDLYSSVAQAIDYCKDEELQNAFQLCSATDIFQWRGVTRRDT